MDRVIVSSTIYRHEQFEEGGEIGWHPVGKAPKETYLAVQPSHRSTAEKALMTLFQHLPEVSLGGGGQVVGWRGWVVGREVLVT